MGYSMAEILQNTSKTSSTENSTNIMKRKADEWEADEDETEAKRQKLSTTSDPSTSVLPENEQIRSISPESVESLEPSSSAEGNVDGYESDNLDEDGMPKKGFRWKATCAKTTVFIYCINCNGNCKFSGKEAYFSTNLRLYYKKI
jgi:hypothetical protein